MNDRIKELADEAGNHADKKRGSWVRDGMWLYEYNQKFAELIVRECANACLKATTEDSPVHLVSVAYADNVKKHFGVE